MGLGHFKPCCPKGGRSPAAFTRTMARSRRIPSVLEASLREWAGSAPRGGWAPERVRKALVFWHSALKRLALER